MNLPGVSISRRKFLVNLAAGGPNQPHLPRGRSLAYE